MMLKLVLIAAVLCGSIAVSSARRWRIGEPNSVRYDHNCDFYGYDIGFLETAGKDCARACRNDRSCTHFTHHDTTCNLKRSNGWLRENAHDGAVCGFFPDRINQQMTVR
ncbi:hypothetical protein BV898_15896 [Hypsibius exemplaris]|uniref:Apple domain-containing protein n=1 Tax=Hypsibius exemplaris TaxID=2072580 RepID=A0A9X6NEU1_HYPEX|nr:hypothetical protein BV898_15896 [Hypsibius exemplaris]